MMNNIKNADSYKVSHFTFMEEGTTKSYSYIEARGGGLYPKTVFFGLQYYLREYLAKPITQENIDTMARRMAAHGEPFNRKGWEYILEKHQGRLPLVIKALPEGIITPLGTVLAVVENTDPECAWLTSYIETALLRAVWYPTTVATQSYEMKLAIKENLEQTGDVSLLPFKLVDFGARGAAVTESAALGGAAHLLHFQSTDNIIGIDFAIEHYGCGSNLPGFSIPATEHAVTTSWRRDRELDFYRNILKVHGKPGQMISVVMDTYDIDAAIDMWGIDLKDELIASGATLVVRPDSGIPKEMVVHVLNRLETHFGSSLNDKGFKVLPGCVRVIQGDGITLTSLREILKAMKKAKWSGDNVTFGSGGFLLQQVNRDTLRFAMKASYVVVNGDERLIRKEPKTDLSKSSKAGRFAVVQREGEIVTIAEHDLKDGEVDLLGIVYLDGFVKSQLSFDQVKANLQIAA